MVKTWFAVLLLTFVAFIPHSADAGAQTPASDCPPSSPLPPADEAAVRRLAEASLDRYRRGNITGWSIVNVRGEGPWAIVELAPTLDGAGVPGDGDVLIAHAEDGEWSVAAPGTPTFDLWLEDVPETLLIPFPERGLFRVAAHETASTSGLYTLPFACEKSAYVSRAGVDHDNAIDFLIEDASLGDDAIVAAAGGWVHTVVDTRTACCCDSSYHPNYVILRHPNDEYSYYVHLAAHSVTVSVGAWVDQGTVLGVEGDVGYSCGSAGGLCRTRFCEVPGDYDYCCEHLHFEVRNSGSWSGSRLNPRFADVPGELVSSGQTYTSGNCGHSYQPETEITAGPGGWIAADSATFAWSGSDDQTPAEALDYSYRLDDAPWSDWTGALTTTYHHLAEGPHTFHVKARDEAGDEDLSPAVRQFGVDTVAPNAPSLQPGCVAEDRQWQNTCRDPDFSWHAGEPNGGDGSGVGQYAYVWTSSPGNTPSDWSDATSYDPDAVADVDGVARYYLHVRARDGVSHTSPVSTFGLWYDGSVPTTNITLNGGAQTSHQVDVQVDLTSGDSGSGVADLRLSHNGLHWSAWHPYTEAVSWTLPALDRRTLPVYAQVRDGGGNRSAVVSETIDLDLYPPMPHSASYRLCDTVVDVGGSVGLTSTHYTLTSALGQPAATGAEAHASARFTARGGFLAALSGCRPITRPVTDTLALRPWVIAAGGSVRDSASYRLNDTVGQPSAGGARRLRSTNLTLASGFWGLHRNGSGGEEVNVYLPLVVKRR